MSFTLILFFTLPLFLFSSSPSIVFIHIGKKLPAYSEDAVRQAKHFNPKSAVYFLLNDEAYQTAPYSLEDAGASVVFLESVPISTHHKKFKANTKLNLEFRDGFWLFTSERFFYLDSFMEQNGLNHVFHLEYDNMLYKNLGEIIPALEKNYPECGATFLSDNFVIPGCIYFATPKAASNVAKFFSRNRKHNWCDMTMLAKYKKTHRNRRIEHLPTIPPQYLRLFQLVNLYGEEPLNGSLYSSHFDKLKGIFDAATIGQYLGGQDPRNGKNFQGFKREDSYLNLDNCQFEWSEDHFGKKIPLMIIDGDRIPIYNLHIHSKNLRAFRSDLETRIPINFNKPNAIEIGKLTSEQCL